jgi:hypothetical protein
VTIRMVLAWFLVGAVLSLLQGILLVFAVARIGSVRRGRERRRFQARYLLRYLMAAFVLAFAVRAGLAALVGAFAGVWVSRWATVYLGRTGRIPWGQLTEG